MLHRAHYFPWVFVSGAVAGFFQMAPLSGGFQCCCTPWLLFGGMAAVLAVGERAKAPIEPGEAAFVGLLSGISGGVVAGLFSMLRTLFLDSTGLAAMVLRGREDLLGMGVARFAFDAVVSFMLYAVVLGPPLGVLGGLVSVPLTRSRARTLREEAERAAAMPITRVPYAPSPPLPLSDNAHPNPPQSAHGPGQEPPEGQR